jgi:hypothetical protein
MALCTSIMHKLVDNLRGSFDHTPLDWANMPNPFRHYEGVSVVAPKTLQPLVSLNRNNGEDEPLMRGVSFHSTPIKKSLKPFSWLKPCEILRALRIWRQSLNAPDSPPPLHFSSEQA